MGSIRVRKHKNKTSYEYRVFVDEIGKYKSFSDETANKAEKKYKAWYKDFLVNGPPKPKGKTLRTVVNAYIDNKTNILSPSTIREYRRISNKEFQDIMDKDVNDITKSMYQEEVNKQSSGRSTKTVINNFSVIKAALKEQCDIVVNVKFPQRVTKKSYVPKTAEIRYLLDIVKGTSLEIPVMLTAFCGMRRGEICAFDHINTDNTITMNKTQVITETGSYVIKPCAKSEAGNRTVFVPDFVAETIRKHQKPYITLNIQSLTKAFCRLKEKHNIPYRFHDLRHYYASLLHGQGIPDKYVIERIGHSTDVMLKKIYQHTMEEKEREIDSIVNRKLDELFT